MYLYWKLELLLPFTALSLQVAQDVDFINRESISKMGVARSYIREHIPSFPQLKLFNDDHLLKGTHVARHGYIKDRETMEFKEATDRGEKLDSTKKKKTSIPSGRPRKNFGLLPTSVMAIGIREIG